MTKPEQVPSWAELLLDLIMTHEGISEPPEVCWTTGPLPRGGSRSFNSAGLTCGNAIAIDLGRSERDARHTFIHELAHWATGNGHTAPMYAKLYELLWLFGEPGDLDYARSREDQYQPEASVQGYQRFSKRIHGWADRLQDYVERLSLVGISTIVAAIGVM